MTNRLLLVVLVALAPACSALLRFDECEVDAHCEMGSMCVDGSCRAAADDEIVVAGTLTEDTVWERPSSYVLDGVVFVAPGVTLTVRSGVTVRGREGSALIVEPGGALLARGTEFEPVVFTSDAADGERLPGDWGGLALLGRAPVNTAGAVLEGLVETDRAGYGGTDPSWSCGVLEYVRVEFAGFALEQDEELNGITLAGCGQGTLISHVQVHRGLDDGIEIFGGTVDMRNVVVTRAQDDGIDWDQGWRGAAQFVVVQQDAEGDNCFEGSNSKADHDASPRSAPRFYNVTLVGPGTDGSTRAMTLKEGTAGLLHGVMMLGQTLEGIDVKDGETAEQLMAGELALDYAMMFDIGPDRMHWFPSVAEETQVTADDGLDDDMGFDEAAWFTANATLTLGVDPTLPAPYALDAPDWVPLGNAPSQSGMAVMGAPFDGFDELAGYAGAFAPAVGSPWTDNWTAYPDR